MRVLFFGDREWDEPLKVFEELQRYDPGLDTIVHGAARGADYQAGYLAEAMGFEVEEHPADWVRYGRSAGVMRNQEMLDSGIDEAVGFHHDIESSKGTADMKRRLDKAGVSNRIVT